MQRIDSADYPAGVPNGHHLVNRSDRLTVFLVVGTRAPRERCHFPDVDLVLVQDENRVGHVHKSGETYPDARGA